MAKLIGTEPFQTPRNADLGTLAYQNHDRVNLSDLTIDAKPVGATVPFRIKTDQGSGAGMYLDNTARSSGRTWGILNGNAGNGYFSLKDETASATRLAIDTSGNVNILDGGLQISGATIIRSDGGIERNARQYIDLQHTPTSNHVLIGNYALWYSAYKTSNAVLGSQHGNGTYYNAIDGISSQQMILYYAFHLNSAKQVRVGGTFTNFADSVSRNVEIQYSLDLGETWTSGVTASISSTSGSFQEFTINLASAIDHLGVLLVRYIYSSAAYLVGFNRVYIETIGSSAGPTLIPDFVEPNQYKIVSNQSHQSDRPRWHKRVGYIMASSFTNPTQNLLTVSGAAANHILSVYVKMHQVKYTTVGGSSVQEGLAEYVNGGTNTVHASNLVTTLSTGGGTPSGSLSWSGNTLQINGVRGSNYDRYYVTVEVVEANNVSWEWNI